MRTLRRILFERKTRRFLDEMIHKYANIRLSATTRQMSRKRQRSGIADELHYSQTRGNRGLGDSSECRATFERSSCPSSTLFDSRRSEQNSPGKERQWQQQLDAAQIENWRISDSRTESEFGSALSSARLTRLVFIEEDELDNQPCAFGSLRDSDSSSITSSLKEAKEDQENCLSFSECGSIFVYTSAPTPLQPSEGNQQEAQPELSRSDRPSSSSASATRLPRLQPTPSLSLVRPNCCDFFTSPHPHYAKEKVGKEDDLSHSDSSQTNSTSEENFDNASDNECGHGATNDCTRNSDEFEMWDYVCPQYTRRVYLNEWV